RQVVDSAAVRSPLLLLLALAACGPTKVQPPPPKDPPQVFLTVEKASVYGTGISMAVTVNGCDQVLRLEMLEHDSSFNPAKVVAWKGNPTTVTLISGDFYNQYGTYGIAPDLVLSAKATCDDARSNKSLPAAARYF